MKNFYIISVDKIYSSREPGLTCNVNEYIKRPNKSTFWCRIWVIDTLRQHECKDCQAAGRAQVSSGRARAVSAASTRGGDVRWPGRLSLVADGEAGDNNTTTLLLLLPTFILAAHTFYSGWNICIGHRIPPPHLSPCIVSLTATLSLSLSRLNLDTEARPRRCGVRRRGAGSSVMSAGQSLTRSDAPAADWDSKRYRQWHKISKICIFIFFIISFVAMSR